MNFILTSASATTSSITKTRRSERDAAGFIDEHPLNVLEIRLIQLQTVIPTLDWSGAQPTVPDDIPEPSVP